MRYAMGKSACMPVVVSDYIKRHLQLLDDKFLALATNDIRHHFEDYGEHEPNTNLWQELLELLEAQQRERVTRPAKESRPCPVCGKLLEVMSVADNRHSPGGFDVIAHCWSCGSNFEWFCDNELRTFYMAERKLKPHFKDGKLPIAAWRREREQLEQEYKDILTKLSPIHADAKKLWAIHYNIYEVQHEQERQNTATRQKRQEMEH